MEGVGERTVNSLRDLGLNKHNTKRIWGVNKYAAGGQHKLLNHKLAAYCAKLLRTEWGEQFAYRSGGKRSATWRGDS